MGLGRTMTVVWVCAMTGAVAILGTALLAMGLTHFNNPLLGEVVGASAANLGLALGGWVGFRWTA